MKTVRRWLHRRCEARTDALEAQNTTVRKTLSMVRSERDRLLVIVRALREVTVIPSQLEGAVNCAVALESESDLEDAEVEVEAYLAAHGIRADGEG